jgi:hypothetical protein
MSPNARWIRDPQVITGGNDDEGRELPRGNKEGEWKKLNI